MRDGIVDAVREFRADPAGARGAHHRRGRRVLRGHGPLARRPSRRPASPASRRAPPPRRCAPACRRSSASCGSSTSRRSPRSTAPRSGRARTSRSRATSCSCTRARASSGRSRSGASSPTPAARTCSPASSGCRGRRRWSCSARARPAPRPSTSGSRTAASTTPDALLPEALDARAQARRRPDPLARALEAAAQRVVRDRPRALARARGPLPGARHRRRPISSRAWPRSARSATRSSTARERSSAHANACSASPRTTCASTTRSRLLMCRLSDITERPGLRGRCPAAASTSASTPRPGALRELDEETGLAGRIVELLAVDSIRTVRARAVDGVEADYHSVRIVYRTEITGGELRARDGREHRSGRVVHARRARRRCRSSSSAGSASSSRSAQPRLKQVTAMRIPIRYANAVALAAPARCCSRRGSRTSGSTATS